MTTPTPTATPEQAAATVALWHEFGRFVLAGGLDLDHTHQLGSAYLALWRLASAQARSAGIAGPAVE